MKAGVPARRRPTSRACSTRLGVPAPALARDAYTLDEFVDELAGPGGDSAPCNVHKRRVRYTVGGCTAEVTDVVADGQRDADDRDRVRGRGRGRRGRPRRSASATTSTRATRRAWPRSSTARPQRYAVIDVGTNSVKFHVGERGRGRRLATVVDRAEVTRLGEGLEETRRDRPEALERTAAAIAGMVEEAQAHGALAIAAVGTAGLRIARNRDAVVAAIRRATGVDDRGDLGRGGEPPRVPRRRRRARARPRARSSCSTPAAAARSSRSATATASTSASAWTSARCATRSASGSPAS